MKKSYILAALCATVTCAATVASAEVKSSVFDDVKVWYKGSAGNAVGTKDSGGVSSGSYYCNKIKSLPHLADPSSSMHGGYYFWWGWRMQYKNQKVDCPYAGVTLDSTPCMVVPEYEGTGTTKGTTTVVINGEETTQPYWTARRFGNYWFDNWMSDWQSGSVCSNWTCVLRFRSDIVNHASGNPNKIIDIGSAWNDSPGKATGVSLLLNVPTNIVDYACPRTFVTTTQKNYTDIKIMNGRWVDCAIAVNGQTLTLWFCWNDGTDESPTNKLAKISETYPTTKGLPTISAGCRVNLASAKDAYSGSFTNGVYSSDLGNKAFEGAFHQIAFWDRTLSDDEIREAMAGGTGRPNLIQIGIEGNGINEFAASGNVASVANSGAWENLNPSLTSGNPTATISFTCPALWAGMPQWLRVCGASGSSGKVSASINGISVGECNVPANRVGHIFVPANVITSGANTLVLTCANGSPVLDAVTLGGSWKFGENVSSFNNAAVDSSLAGKVGPDCWVFNPACGNDKFHARGTTWSINGDKFSFPFFVPADLIGKFHGELMFKSSNAAESGGLFSSQMNDTLVRDTSSYAKNTEYSSIVPENAFVAGWNEAAWNREAYWINFDTFQFTLVDAPKPTIIVLE